MRIRYFLSALIALFIAFNVGVPLAFAACCSCGTAADPNAKICITQTTPGSCANLPDSTANPKAKTLTNCVEDEVCKPVSQQGTCKAGPTAESAYGAGAAAATTETPGLRSVQLTPLDLNIKIPNLVFSNTAIEKGGYIEIPFFAQYVAAVYKFLMVISAIAAAVMIVYGGFLYIAAASGAKVRQGRTIIVDAVIGLILILGTYVILNTVNPDTLKLNAVKVSLVRPQEYSYMAGRYDAPNTMSDIGIQAGASPGDPTNHGIPSGSCPGRDPKYVDPNHKTFKLGNVDIPTSWYSICTKQGRCLDQKVIDYFLEEQKRTGVPAGVLMAQVFTESGVGGIFCLADGTDCGLHYNFGGIGCTARQVPAGSCPNLAYTKRGYEPFNGNKPHPLPCTTFNSGKELGPACVAACEANAGTDCGPDCYPQQSNAGIGGGAETVWFPSIQCSRVFKSGQDFFDSHLGFVQPCLAYKDSVYNFAYCIGASTYSGNSGAKGLVLAEIIERNCLCDPATDSTGCKRDPKIEEAFRKNQIKPTFLNDRKFKKADGSFDYDALVKTLMETTHGMLKPGTLVPQNDIEPPDHP